MDELNQFNFNNRGFITWRTLHMLLTTTSSNKQILSKNLKLQSLELDEFNYIKYTNLVKSSDFAINSILNQNFKKFNYLFSFYIYKVDKQIYKNSRGRSGKYTFVWKYVAPYKRHFLILH